MERGYIKPNKSPYWSPILFVDKKDGKLYWKQLENKQEMKYFGSWNGTIVLINKKITKVVSFNATITKLWFATTNNAWRFNVLKNHERREWKTIQNHSTIYYLLTLK
jgi:hypothetical protein